MNHLEVMRLFERIGTIHEYDFVDRRDPMRNERRLRSHCEVADIRPGVYAWVEHKIDGSVRVIYIGKAEVNIPERQAQHNNGFKHSDRGQSHAEAIRAMIAGGSIVELHAYYPELPVGEVEKHLLREIRPFPIRNSAGRAASAA